MRGKVVSRAGCCWLLLSLPLLAQTATSPQRPASSTKTSTKKSPASKTKKPAAAKTTAKKPSAATHESAASRKRKEVGPKPTAQSIRLKSAFVASAQLRPMAQQLAATRSVAAYSGVESYARQHPGEAAAAAYLALGHAYMLDRRYSEAAAAFRQGNVSGAALDDYADYLGAQAAVLAGRGQDAYALLDRFAERHPESIFVSGEHASNAPVLLANAHLQQNDAHGALAVLTPLLDSPVAIA